MNHECAGLGGRGIRLAGRDLRGEVKKGRNRPEIVMCIAGLAAWFVGLKAK